MAGCASHGRGGRRCCAARSHSVVQHSPIKGQGVGRCISQRSGRRDHAGSPRAPGCRCARGRIAAAVRRNDAGPREALSVLLSPARAWRSSRVSTAVALAVRPATRVADARRLAGVAVQAARAAAPTGRIDTAALKLAHPIEDVVARYGIELKRRGRALVGRCPFHADGGRPNLSIFPTTRTWFCFRCCLGGDAVKFIMLAEDVGFLQAVERLAGAALGPVRASPKYVSRPAPITMGERDAEELAVLQATVTLYHHNLLAEPRALAYLSGRGLDRAIIAQCRLGYATGEQLAAYLRW